MKLWEPKKCCCCATTRTGTLIIGWLSVCGGLFNIFGLIKTLFSATGLIYETCQKASEHHNESCNTYAVAGILVGGAFQLIMVGFYLAMLYGVYKNKPRLMLPYMIERAVMIVVAVPGVLAGIIICMYFGKWIIAAILLIVCPPVIFLFTYLLLVVRVHYKELTQPEKTGNEGIEIGGLPQKA